MAGFLGNPKLTMMTQDRMPVANYEYPQNPAIDTDPVSAPVSWLNTLTGEIFVCTDNTPGSNVWKGQMGTTIPTP